MTDKEKDFLIELAELTKRTGVSIGGCGCCGSPYLQEEDSIGDEYGYYIDTDTGRIAFVDSDDKISWNDNKNKIIRKSENTLNESVANDIKE